MAPNGVLYIRSTQNTLFYLPRGNGEKNNNRIKGRKKKSLEVREQLPTHSTLNSTRTPDPCSPWSGMGACNNLSLDCCWVLLGALIWELLGWLGSG